MSSSESESSYPCADIIRAVVLNDARNQVLLVNTDNTWDLPCFSYEQEPHGRWDGFCADLDAYLHIRPDSKPMFSVLFDLINWIKSKEDHDGATAYLYQVIMDYRLSQAELEVNLPPNVKWKDLNFITHLIVDDDAKEDKQVAFRELQSLLAYDGIRLRELKV